MTYRDLFRFENDETTQEDYSKFKIDESKQSTYEQLIEAYRKYIDEYFGWDNTLEDVKEDIKHDYLTNVEAKDGTILLHYLDECHELVVLPDRVLDDEDDIREYEKYIR